MPAPPATNAVLARADYNKEAYDRPTYVRVVSLKDVRQFYFLAGRPVCLMLITRLCM